MTPYGIAVLVLFCVAYVFIICEELLRVEKTATALLAGGLCWMAIFLHLGGDTKAGMIRMGETLSDTSQIIFFLMGAMTIVELIDSHHGFQLISRLIRTRSKVSLVWLVGPTAFFVSAVLDNLTSTIVMVSVLRKIIPDIKERWFFGALVVVAANAGGAWTPIGDVTTTLLWIAGNLTTWSVIAQLFLPSFVALLVVLIYASILMRGKKITGGGATRSRSTEPGARLIFTIGICALIAVPILKELTGLPPFMVMLIGVAVLWLATDVWHYGHQDREHLKLPQALTRVDMTSVLFFLGILLAVGALDAAHWLKSLADWLDTTIPSPKGIAVIIGLLSAVIDNVPLVAGAISMYPLDVYAQDSEFWHMIAYCAGTGGSLLIIGSAAGIALMGLEKVGFIWYLLRITPIALVSYFAGVATYLLLH